MEIPKALIEKYNVPAPRYTSYPTLPFWGTDYVAHEDWTASVSRVFKESNSQQGISLYIHLPYCESLCTYCACNTRITKNHGVEGDYINALLAEWALYLQMFNEKPMIREIHLGGGTPTFFAPENIKKLIIGILKNADKHEKYSFSFEGHPNNTTREHLQTLFDLGFRRVSYGIQDLNFKVQKTINRIQPYKNVVVGTNTAKEIGYESVNFDLIYGLPFQTEYSIEDTIEKAIALHPERIAFYSYAHVPWKRPGQRAYTESDLPADSFKRKLYEIGKSIFLQHGYSDIGMDHFALNNDELYRSYQHKTLHRNFMGYTHNKTNLLVGLGASAIGDAKYAYIQNCKNVEDYKKWVMAGRLPVTKGHFLSEEDSVVRGYILDILCAGEVSWKDHPGVLDINGLIGLNEMHQEGLIKLYETGFRVTTLGMPFLRNICMWFDKYIGHGPDRGSQTFSKAI